MAMTHEGTAAQGAVDLAHEPRFRLGSLCVDPATRQIDIGGHSLTLEPRVMRVLVALAQAGGAIVTRDELTRRCWDGRIVGEDAINRTLSRIRAVFAEANDSALRIETITKVGYRLLVGSSRVVGSAHPERTRLFDPSRRKLIAGGALAAAGFGILGWRQAARGYRPTTEALTLYRMGVSARSLGLVATSEQATSYFRQAVRADPEYADAWGALSRQLTNGLGGASERAIASATEQARSAARRALALDPGQVDALGTMVLTQPRYRHWGQFEGSLRRFLRKYPDHRPAKIELASLYCDVARWDEAVTILQQVRAAWPLVPGPSGLLCQALWSAERAEEAEIESVAATERWPRFHGTWFARMILLTYGGNPDRAVAFAANLELRPTGTGAEGVIGTRVAAAKALVSRIPAEIAEVRSTLIASAEATVLNAPPAVRFLGAIGDKESMFELIDAYFRRRGRYASDAMKPIGLLAPLLTEWLFHPTSRLLWRDPRFAALTRDIGLDAYWQAASFKPSHRRR